MLLRVLVLLAAAGGERVVVNRRARQRQPVTEAGPSLAPDPELERRFRVQSAFSLALANSGFGYTGDNVTSYYDPSPVTSYYDPSPVTTYYEPAPVTSTTPATVARVRVPRRRTQLSRGRVSAGSEAAPVTASSSAGRSSGRGAARARARIPRRRQRGPSRDLERAERNTVSVERDLGPASRRLASNLVDTADPASKPRSRSRSRHRPRPAPSPATTEASAGRGRGRTLGRTTGPAPRPRLSPDTGSSPGTRLSSSSGRAPVTTPPARPRPAAGSAGGPKVIFPRKDLFPKLSKLSLAQANEVDTGRGPADNNYNYKLNKEKLRSSLAKVPPPRYPDPSQPRARAQDESPDHPRPRPEASGRERGGYRESYRPRPDTDYSDTDYSYTDLQSGLSEAASGETVATGASNNPSQSLMLYNYGEGFYYVKLDAVFEAVVVVARVQRGDDGGVLQARPRTRSR